MRSLNAETKFSKTNLSQENYQEKVYAETSQFLCLSEN